MLDLPTMASIQDRIDREMAAADLVRQERQRVAEEAAKEAQAKSRRRRRSKTAEV